MLIIFSGNNTMYNIKVNNKTINILYKGYDGGGYNDKGDYSGR